MLKSILVIACNVCKWLTLWLLSWPISLCKVHVMGVNFDQKPSWLVELRFYWHLLPTAGEGNVLTGVCHSVHIRPHIYSFTAHRFYGAVGMHPTWMLSCLQTTNVNKQRALHNHHRECSTSMIFLIICTSPLFHSTHWYLACPSE